MGSSRRQLMLGRAYGVVVGIEVDDRALLDEATPRLPPGWTFIDRGEAVAAYVGVLADGDRFHILRDGQVIGATPDRDLATKILAAEVEFAVATRSTPFTFIHAGVVVVAGSAIVLPGRSFAGKSTLVHALVTRGAAYFSDEFAVLDDDGQVHPYPRPLALRSRRSDEAREGVGGQVLTAEELGGSLLSEPTPIGVVARVPFLPGAQWACEQRSPGQGALMLLAHGMTSREAPKRVLNVSRRAAARAAAYEGQRGEADEAAAALLDLAAQV